ncbi:MAG: PAS domain S-box protein [Actinobacteria bacterium]|nr:MAG: PAS domain S-box protein [Actinomycetota bacterium]
MESLHDQPEWSRVVLASIGDAVITTDSKGQITFLNAVAESLTGWTQSEAMGQPLDRVFHIINEHSRQAIESPTVRALRDGVVVGLANHSLLIAKNGTDRPIDDSAAPIRNERGEVAGVVLVFRDISQRRHAEQEVQAALAYADNIIATLREPFLVLDKSLRVRTANACFYREFGVSQEETEGRFVYELGNRQWDIPRLRTLLEEVLPQNHSFQDYDVEHDFPTIGRRIMLLNARRFVSVDSRPELILLAIEDITERRRAELAVQTSEVRYRRLFETAKDGILILDADTGRVPGQGTVGDRSVQRQIRKRSRLSTTATTRLYPLRPPTARKQRRQAGGSRVRQQRLSCGSPTRRSVQRSGHQRA